MLMKVILKGGSKEKNEGIKQFFIEKIFPILTFGIAIEPSGRVITVFEKKGDQTLEYIDPTAEVIVELTEEARNLAMDPEVGVEELSQVTGQFHDEALAVRALEIMQLPFSVEYYCCRYTPPTEHG